jgi:hypothetical protein
MREGTGPHFLKPSPSSLAVGSHPVDLSIRKAVVDRGLTTSLVARRTLVSP